jgi:hypothetical protein
VSEANLNESSDDAMVEEVRINPNNGGVEWNVALSLPLGGK